MRGMAPLTRGCRLGADIRHQHRLVSDDDTMPRQTIRIGMSAAIDRVMKFAWLRTCERAQRDEPRERPASAPKALRRGLAGAFSEGGSAPAKRRGRARGGG